MDKIIGNSLHIIKKQMQSYLNNALKEEGLKSSEALVLKVLGCQGKTSQIELARALDCDKAHIHRITNKLLDKDLICFNDDNPKSRNHVLFLTEKGQNIILRINKSIENWIDKIKVGIKEEDLSAFKRVVLALIENASKINLEIKND